MNRYQSAEDRFWARVDKTDDCWLWTGSSSQWRNHHPHLMVEGQFVRVNRFSWELHNEPIPEGLWVLHHCDDAWCVNPAHLFLGSAGDNTRDCVRKRRHVSRLAEFQCASRYPDRVARADKASNARLTWEQVREIRAIRNDQGLTYRAIAKQFGVGPMAIWKICNYRSWIPT